MRISLIQVPYHYGFLQAGRGAGRGPLRYLDAGVEQALRRSGFEVAVQTVQRGHDTQEILAAVVTTNTALAAHVASARGAGAFPLVLSGGCSVCLGVLAGLKSRVGIIWFDAHGDFNTPETTASGFFEGMPLAIATGLCYHELWSQIANLPPVPPAQALLVGVRDLDPGERDNLERSKVQVAIAAEIKAAGVAASLQPKLAQLHSHVDEVYLHFDIDVLDPAIAPGVDYRTPDGLSLREAEEAIQMIAARFRIQAAALTAYNPDHEENDRTLQAGLRVLHGLVGVIARSRQ
ncbi:MAG: arginase family protein [Terriglobia bacterium]